jgi:hypothetical protein
MQNPKESILEYVPGNQITFWVQNAFSVHLTSKQCPIPRVQDVTDINFGSVLKWWSSKLPQISGTFSLKNEMYSKDMFMKTDFCDMQYYYKNNILEIVCHVRIRENLW